MNAFFNSPHRRIRLLAALSVLLVGLGIAFLWGGRSEAGFDGQRALRDVETQIAFGPRVSGSFAQSQMIAWLVDSLQRAGWQAEIQEDERMGHPIRNIVARKGDTPPEVILGAHYDSRMLADQDTDPQLKTQPVPGANDGASGVAVLLELARSLPEEAAQTTWLVFFDAEDNGNIPGWDWILGSRAFAESLEALPEAVVVVDMVGDAQLTLPQEQNSDEELVDAIWGTAVDLGYGEIFLDEARYRMLDDHIPFLDRGIPSVDIIDFDYPYWHTSQDTVDKVSADSLAAVGETLWSWLKKR